MVDVVIRIAKPDLFMLAGIKDELEQSLGRPVDLVTYRERMNRFLRDRIDKEAVYA
jgi:predicted nucleotidyltransferase